MLRSGDGVLRRKLDARRKLLSKLPEKQKKQLAQHELARK